MTGKKTGQRNKIKLEVYGSRAFVVNGCWVAMGVKTHIVSVEYEVGRKDIEVDLIR